MDSPFEARWQVPPGDPTACRWHLSKAASNWPSMDGGVESGGGAARQVLGEVVARSWRGRGEDGGPDLGRRRRQGSGVEEASRSCVSGGETECGRRRDNVVAVVGSGATGARVTNERCRPRKKKKWDSPNRGPPNWDGGAVGEKFGGPTKMIVRLEGVLEINFCTQSRCGAWTLLVI
jgi:hypothetical protein